MGNYRHLIYLQSSKLIERRQKKFKRRKRQNHVDEYPLGVIPRILDTKKAEQKIISLSKYFGLSVEPRSRVSDLAVGVQQRVEIIKTLYRNAELLVLDEPTSVRTPQETRDFFRILKTLVQQEIMVS
jgi:ABC-type uncharacterized transport system ATPase subunit